MFFQSVQIEALELKSEAERDNDYSADQRERDCRAFDCDQNSSGPGDRWLSQTWFGLRVAESWRVVVFEGWAGLLTASCGLSGGW